METTPAAGGDQFGMTRREVIALTAAGLAVGAPGLAKAAAAPEGQLTWAAPISLATTWFEPAETPAIITPFMVLYALHDAMVKPMPGNPLTPPSRSLGRPRGRPQLRLRCARLRRSTTASR